MQSKCVFFFLCSSFLTLCRWVKVFLRASSSSSLLFVKSREIIQSLVCVYTKCISRNVDVTEKLLQPFLHPQLWRFPGTSPSAYIDSQTAPATISHHLPVSQSHSVTSSRVSCYSGSVVAAILLCFRNCFFIGTTTQRWSCCCCCCSFCCYC